MSSKKHAVHDASSSSSADSDKTTLSNASVSEPPNKSPRLDHSVSSDTARPSTPKPTKSLESGSGQLGKTKGFSRKKVKDISPDPTVKNAPIAGVVSSSSSANPNLISTSSQATTSSQAPPKAKGVGSGSGQLGKKRGPYKKKGDNIPPAGNRLLRGDLASRLTKSMKDIRPVDSEDDDDDEDEDDNVPLSKPLTPSKKSRTFADLSKFPKSRVNSFRDSNDPAIAEIRRRERLKASGGNLCADKLPPPKGWSKKSDDQNPRPPPGGIRRVKGKDGKYVSPLVAASPPSKNPPFQAPCPQPKNSPAKTVSPCAAAEQRSSPCGSRYSAPVSKSPCPSPKSSPQKTMTPCANKLLAPPSIPKHIPTQCTPPRTVIDASLDTADLFDPPAGVDDASDSQSIKKLKTWEQKITELKKSLDVERNKVKAKAPLLPWGPKVPRIPPIPVVVPERVTQFSRHFNNKDLTNEEIAQVDRLNDAIRVHLYSSVLNAVDFAMDRSQMRITPQNIQHLNDDGSIASTEKILHLSRSMTPRVPDMTGLITNVLNHFMENMSQLPSLPTLAGAPPLPLETFSAMGDDIIQREPFLPDVNLTAMGASIIGHSRPQRFAVVGGVGLQYFDMESLALSDPTDQILDAFGNLIVSRIVNHPTDMSSFLFIEIAAMQVIQNREFASHALQGLVRDLREYQTSLLEMIISPIHILANQHYVLARVLLRSQEIGLYDPMWNMQVSPTYAKRRKNQVGRPNSDLVAERQVVDACTAALRNLRDFFAFVFPNNPDWIRPLPWPENDQTIYIEQIPRQVEIRECGPKVMLAICILSRYPETIVADLVGAMRAGNYTFARSLFFAEIRRAADHSNPGVADLPALRPNPELPQTPKGKGKKK